MWNDTSKSLKGASFEVDIFIAHVRSVLKDEFEQDHEFMQEGLEVVLNDLGDAAQTQQGGFLNHWNTILQQLYQPIDSNLVAAFYVGIGEAFYDICESCNSVGQHPWNLLLLHNPQQFLEYSLPNYPNESFLSSVGEHTQRIQSSISSQGVVSLSQAKQVVYVSDHLLIWQYVCNFW